jgi:hypothetical protein
MSTNELAAKLKSLSPEQRQVVESLIELLAKAPTPMKQRDLTDHPSFGAWASRNDLAADSDAAARELRKRAVRRESA